jgi:hypothetical protein
MNNSGLMMGKSFDFVQPTKKATPSKRLLTVSVVG